MTTSNMKVLLVALVSGCDGCAFRERRLRWIKSNKRLVAPVGYPVAHMFSRWVLRQRYRKVKSVGRVLTRAIVRGVIWIALPA